MSDRIPADSVGLVSPHTQAFDAPVALLCGRMLARMELVYETYGELNAARSNAVLICHALSGHHHAAGYHSIEDERPGWWDSAIGPGKPIDTNLFFVVSLNNLGGLLRALDDLPGAQAAYERALRIFENAYGSDHPKLAICFNNLGFVLRDLKDLPGARAHIERALAILQKSLGDDHPNTRLARKNFDLLPR